jgi:mRNA deadenylase 3'-5' endonuclease subunit Ccr4
MFTEFIADDVLRRDNHAVFVLLKHIPSGKYLIVGNTHLFHNPAFDFVKHAQAVYLLMQATAFHNDALQQLALIDDAFARRDCKTLPFVLAGDFNSQPVSSVMSAIHGEELDSSSWEEDYMSDPLKREFYLKSD